MKKGQIYAGYVERVDFPNKGRIRIETVREDGSTEVEYAVVKNVLPGQKVSFMVNKLRKGKAEGRLLSVEEHAPVERTSPCPHFGICGGCTYLTLPYEEQLKLKEEQVRQLLDSVLKNRQPEYSFEGIKGSPSVYEYRNKMEFSFGDEVKDGPLSLGMHKRGSFYDIVTVSDCCLVDEDYRRILKTTLNLFADRELSFFHRLRHEGYLRHLLVRKAVRTGEILVGLVTTSQWQEESGEEREILTQWKEQILELELTGKIAGLLHIVNDSVADVVKGDRVELLYGKDSFEEELLGLQFQISPFSFFQTNSLGAEVLYRTVREYIGDLQEAGPLADEKKAGEDKRTSVVYDLYSGTGTIAQLMAPVARKVIGVELVEEAVTAARQNAVRNRLENCEFIAGDVLKVLDQIEEKPDFIILDPPRDGVHPKALEKILEYGVERMVYVSCKPTSLARDLEVFLEKGYIVERAVAVDQFPWTANVEVVSLLQRASNTRERTITLDVEMEDYHRIKNEGR